MSIEINSEASTYGEHPGAACRAYGLGRPLLPQRSLAQDAPFCLSGASPASDSPDYVPVKCVNFVESFQNSVTLARSIQCLRDELGGWPRITI